MIKPLSDDAINKAGLLTQDEMEECEQMANIGIDPYDEEADTIYQLQFNSATRLKSDRKVAQASQDNALRQVAEQLEVALNI